MMCNTDKIEKMVPSTEEEEKENENTAEERKDEEEGGEKEPEEKGEEDDDDESEKEGDDEDDEEEGSDDKEEREEVMPQATDKKNPLPVKSKEKKPSDVLNLNNEVVKMRKEVKRVRALIIRKLTRQIAALKKKKGKETEIERNQRRAARLLEEVHAIKNLSPDLVTKTALQKSLNFEQVCKNPKSTISDRAVARIATHPQFNKKIEDIKAAVKAFKEERKKGGKEGRQEKVQNQPPKPTLQSPDKRGERGNENKEEDGAVELKETIDSEEGVGVLKDAEVETVAKAEKEMEKPQDSAGTADAQIQEMPEFKSVRPEAAKSSIVKDIVKNKPQSKAAEKKPSVKPAPAVPQKRTDDEESDLESSDDEEKEYFDDSTEERFHKQSSQSEESDDDDDFFVGKVSKFKKKKKQKNIEEEEKVDKRSEVKKDSIDNVKSKDKLQSELDELESRLKSKAPGFQSVFCSSLAGAKAGRGGGTGRGRGGDKFRGQGKPKGGIGLNRDFSKQSKFQRQEKGTENNSGSKYSKPCPEDRHPGSEAKGFASAGRGRGRGRGDAFRQKSHRGGGFFAHQPPQQALHPSWEASKKRKEQQGQILAFQGKKIKFDDDD